MLIKKQKKTKNEDCNKEIVEEYSRFQCDGNIPELRVIAGMLEIACTVGLARILIGFHVAVVLKKSNF